MTASAGRRSPEERAARRRARAAVSLKEWAEQRWRFVLGTLVMTVLLAGLLRANVIPHREAVLLVYWAAGVVMVILLATGAVAPERAAGTWEFLAAQPLSRWDVFLAKWRVGLAELVAMLVIATLAGAVVLATAGEPALPDAVRIALVSEPAEAVNAWTPTAGSSPVTWLLYIAALSTNALACWYTLLFLLLTGARSEFTAALGGILLAIAVHAWLGQLYVGAPGMGTPSPLMITGLLNPLMPLAAAMSTAPIVFWPAIVLFDVSLWILLPLYLARRRLDAPLVAKGGAA